MITLDQDTIDQYYCTCHDGPVEPDCEEIGPEQMYEKVI